MSVPEWVQDAVFYQIFPDRFFNADSSNDPLNLQVWGSPPTSWGFQGGDLLGILQKLDYLSDLGINAIYLNPIFQASSNHRYNTSDYFKIDPRLGSLEEFHQLIKEVHQRGMRIILDGVFNHCGRGFFAFNDVLENQEYSSYRDWFHIKRFPVNAYSWGEAEDYLGWWGMKSLPKFNTNNPLVRAYLLAVARYWIEQGADGWRLDVPNEINDDSFWGEFRKVVKQANPQAYILGEIWSADSRWVGEGHFDGLMDYPVMEALAGLLATHTLDVKAFAEKVEGLLSLYPAENASAMYVLIGSHDTERILTRLANDVEKTRLAYLFQFAYPGAPAIYYGDEIGMTGAKDPACRGAFSWDESTWNMDIHQLVKRLVAARHKHEALRRGSYLRIGQMDNPACYAFIRIAEMDAVLVILNPSDTEQHARLKLEVSGWEADRSLSDLLQPGKEYPLADHTLEVTLSAWSGLYLG